MNEGWEAKDDYEIWQDTTPSASVVYVTGGTYVAAGEAFINYCFHSVEGYSKIGSYVGNGNADGTFIYTGFRPAFVLVKPYSASDPWEIIDDKRPGYNQASKGIWPSSNATEYSSRGYDLVSNGFKNRTTNGTSNSNGVSYLYYAIAETPFKTSNAQ